MCEQAVKSSSKPSLKISGGARQEATESYGLEFERVPYGPFREVDAGGVVGDCFLSDCEAYNFISLWKFPPYKSLDEAEKAAIKYIDDEIEEHGNEN